MTYKTYLTPARNALPRRTYADSAYYGWKREDTKAYPILPDDTVTTIGKRITPDFYGKYWKEIAEKTAQAYGLSLQELGVTNQAYAPVPQPWLSSTPVPLWGAVNPTPIAKPDPSTAELLLFVDGWTESDFADRRDMYTLMETGQDWSYAMCKWLENKADQFENNDLDWMFPGGIRRWRLYARTHCQRYKAEQPRYIQERDALDNA